MVLGADEVERAAVEPVDDEGAVGGECRVDVGRAEPGGARPHREQRAARVLRLHGADPSDDLERVGRR